MDVTTVKLHKNTKLALDSLRKEQDSYDEVITRLISLAKKRDIKERLVDGYKSMGKTDLKLLEEWEIASKEVD